MEYKIDRFKGKRESIKVRKELLPFDNDSREQTCYGVAADGWKEVCACIGDGDAGGDLEVERHCVHYLRWSKRQSMIATGLHEMAYLPRIDLHPEVLWQDKPRGRLGE